MREQIQEDISGVVSDDLTDEKLAKTMEKKLLLARYTIRDGKLSLTAPQHPRSNYLKKSLQELMEVTTLPNMDFIIALEDAVDGAQLPAPVMAFAKDSTLKEKVLLIPDFDALQKNEKTVEKVHKAIEKYPWSKKKEKAYWRGAATGGTFNLDTFLQHPRSKLVAASIAAPQLIDARLAKKLVQSDEPKKVLEKFGKFFGPASKIPTHLKYKYQVLVDGNTCAYSGAYWRWFSNCLVIKQDSPHIQWYYRALKPNVHYIPSKADFSDLVEKIQWARDHDSEARAISENAQRFANANLQKSDVYLYLYLALLKYAQIQHP